MIWFDGLPVPPSANEMYEPNVTRVQKYNKKGEPYLGYKTSYRVSKALAYFQFLCLTYQQKNKEHVDSARLQILEWINDGCVLRVDTWVAFEHHRIWTLDNHAQEIDADNRRKALQDGLAKIVNIDDKWFFGGNVEKVTCNSKDYECSIIRITPMRARTLTEIQKLKSHPGSLLPW